MVVHFAKRIKPIRLVLPLLLLIAVGGYQTQFSQTSTQVAPLGVGVLGESEQLAQAGKYPEAAAKAIAAAGTFTPASDWLLWQRCYETAFQCTKKAGAIADYRQILPEFNDASTLLEKSDAVPAAVQLTIWRHKGYIHHLLGEYDQALRAYEKALPFAENTADSTAQVRLFGSAAILYWTSGDDYKALDYHEKALGLARAQKDTTMIAAILANAANVWRGLRQPKAIDYYRESLSLVPDNSEALMLLSKAYLELKADFPAASRTAQDALKYAVYDEEKADALHQLGRVALEQGQLQTAEGYFQKALTFAQKGYGPDHPEFAKIHVFRAKVMRQKDQFDPALRACNQTLRVLLPLFEPNAATDNPPPEMFTSTNLWILEALLEKSAIFSQKHQKSESLADLENALSCAETALTFLEKVRLGYGEEESKFAVTEYVQQTCETAIKTAFQLYQLTQKPAYAARAFNISEQTKAATLTETLYRKEIKATAKIPETIREQERQLFGQIAYWSNKMYEDDIQTAKDSLFAAKRALQQLEQQMQRAFPAYADALFAYRVVTNPDSIRRQLPPDAALLEYYLGQKTLFTFLLTKDTFWMQEQTIATAFYPALEAFQKAAGSWQMVRDSSGQSSRILLEQGLQLYNWLLARPLSVTNAPRLFIVPDGALGYLSFDLLPVRAYDGQWVDRDVPFLLKDKAVSYRFSARSTKPPPTQGPWGGWGQEYKDPGTLSALEPQSGEAPNPIALRGGGELPFAGKEIRTLSDMLDGSFWLNQDATRDHFLDNARHYGILHLAMHGIIDPANPLRSKLLFAASAVGEDPFVYASDLYNLQLTAGMAVLSACQSGTGTWKHGEGALSLARAFAFAGCPSMVMSLWNVSDQSTSELMVLFYEELRAGKTKDEALRLAKLNYLKTATSEYAKPIYWAGFIPTGEMNAFPTNYFPQPNTPWGWIALAILGLAGMFWWWTKRRKIAFEKF